MAPLNANQLLNAAKAEAQATTAGPLQQLAQQIASQNAQNANATKAIGGYFQGLGNFVNQNMGALNQVGTDLNNTLSGLSQSEQGQLQGITNNSAALMNQYLPKGDTSVGDAGMQSLINNMAQQQGYATQNIGALQGAAANGQADYQNLAHALAASDAVAGRQDLANVQMAGAAKIAPLATKYSDLVSKQGALTESDLAKLRQQEITNQYHNTANQIAAERANSQANFDNVRSAVYDKTFKLNQFKANTTAANDAAKNQLAAERNQIALRNANTAAGRAADEATYRKVLLGIDQKNANTKAQLAQLQEALDQAKIHADYGGGAKPLSTNENTRNIALIQAAGDAIRTLSKKAGGVNNVVAALERGNVAHLPVMPTAYVQAALENLTTGSVSHDTWLQLKNTYGIRNVPFKVAPPKGK